MSKTATRALCVGFVFMAAAVAFGSPAEAATAYLKFYNGGDGYGGPYNESGTVYDNTRGRATNCPTSGPSSPCGSDNLATPQAYWSAADLTATAGGAADNLVWDDLSPVFGGLGVGSLSDPSDADQIAGTVVGTGDVLTLSFTNAIKLEGVGTLFDVPHQDFGDGFLTAQAVADAATEIFFKLSVNGGAFQDVSFYDANNMLLTGLEGKTFAFMQAASNPEFYVSALAFEVCGGDVVCGNVQTPLPAALPLFATGLGALGLLGWRRKRKAQAAL